MSICQSSGCKNEARRSTHFCSLTCRTRHAEQLHADGVDLADSGELFAIDPRKRVDDPAAVDVLTRAARRARPLRKVSEVVAELGELWGLDSDDAGEVICTLADKIRAQDSVSGPTDPTPDAGPDSRSKPVGPG